MEFKSIITCFEMLATSTTSVYTKENRYLQLQCTVETAVVVISSFDTLSPDFHMPNQRNHGGGYFRHRDRAKRTWPWKVCGVYIDVKERCAEAAVDRCHLHVVRTVLHAQTARRAATLSLPTNAVATALLTSG